MSDREPSSAEVDNKYALGILQEQLKASQRQSEAGQQETNRRLERIEKKIDEQNYVSVSTFNSTVDDLRKQMVTQDQFRPFKVTSTTISTAIVGAFIAAVVAFVIRGGLR